MLGETYLDRPSSDPFSEILAGSLMPTGAPRYQSGETSRQRSEDHMRHQQHGLAVKEAVLEQRQAANRKVKAMLRRKGRVAAKTRTENKRLERALDDGKAAYHEHARQRVAKQAETRNGIRQARDVVHQRRQNGAKELRGSKEREWDAERRQQRTAREYARAKIRAHPVSNPRARTCAVCTS